MKMRIADINTEGRVRADFGEVDDLAKSIERHGLIHPPVVTKSGDLVAGERRLTACKALGMEEIPVRLIEELSSLEMREIELEENIVRKDFTWQEEVQAKREIHRIKQQQEGARVKGHKSDGWGVKDTAEALNESVGTVSQDIQLADALERFPEIAEEENKHRAWKKYRKLEKQAEIDELLEELEGRDESEFYELINGDCVEWMKKQPSKSIDLVIADPPWGIEMHKNSRMSRDHDIGYSDSLEDVAPVIREMINEAYRILKDDAHMYLYFGIANYSLIRQMVEDAGFEIDVVPVIWNKDHASSAAKLRTYPKAYETIFFCYKGKRDLNITDHDVFTVKRPAGKGRIHSAQKPIELEKKFIIASSYPGERVLVPFAGSGAAIVAAVQENRYGIGIEKSEENFAKMVKFVRSHI